MAGSGGYWHLHGMAAEVKQWALPHTFQDHGVRLEHFVDDRHGFLRVEAAPQYLHLEFFTVPRPQESWRAPAQLADSCTLDLRARRLVAGRPAVAAAPARQAPGR